jgi:membrane-associated phospholipid phosphatase
LSASTQISLRANGLQAVYLLSMNSKAAKANNKTNSESGIPQGKTGEGSRLCIGALLFAVAAVLVTHFDTSLVKWADGTHVRGDVRRVLDMAEAYSFGPAAIVIALGVFLSDQRSKWVTARLFAYPIVAGLFADVLKLGIPRLRPRGLAELAILQDAAPSGWDTFALFNSVPGFDQIGNGSSSIWQAFPSAHSATAVGLAIGLCRLYPHARWYFLALAVFAGLQRIVATAHYPSDVLAGASVAMLSCWLLERKSFLSLAISNRTELVESRAPISLSRAA